MNFNTLFEQRLLVGKKLKDILREKGFSKIAFCKKADISRPTLDRILNGSIDNKSSYDKHMEKILLTLHLTVEDFLLFDIPAKPVNVVFSQNAPEDYNMNSKAKKQFDLLMDLLNLCNVYYSGGDEH